MRYWSIRDCRNRNAQTLNLHHAGYGLWISNSVRSPLLPMTFLSKVFWGRKEKSPTHERDGKSGWRTKDKTRDHTEIRTHPSSCCEHPCNPPSPWVFSILKGRFESGGMIALHWHAKGKIFVLPCSNKLVSSLGHPPYFIFLPVNNTQPPCSTYACTCLPVPLILSSLKVTILSGSHLLNHIIHPVGIPMAQW